MSKEDDVFFREFGLILAFLFVFFLIAIFTARAIGSNAFEAARLAPGEVEKRIDAVGTVFYGEADALAEIQVVKVAMAEPRGGEEIYNTGCVACHGNGTLGAPKLGSAEDWGPRVAQGMNTLIKAAINGKGVKMPPKGGRADFSDEEVIAGLKYMLEKSSVDAN